MEGSAVFALVAACWVAIAACDRNRSSLSTPSDDSRAGGGPAASDAGDTPQHGVPLGVHRPHDLLAAATDVVRFLRGELGSGRIRLADTVTLQLGPEGGGVRRRIGREALRNRSNWSVRSGSLRNGKGTTYSLIPPEGRAELTAVVGRHLNCREYPLSSISEELASLPHVGTTLAYGTGCLQTWNLTLVFDPDKKPPIVVAAVYDQFEW